MTDDDSKRPARRKLAVLLALALVVVAGVVTAVVLWFSGDDDAGSNDTFADAKVISGGQFSGSTGGAPEASRAAVDAGVLKSGEHAVWFRWTAVNGGWAYVTAAQAGGTLPSVRAFSGTELDNLVRVDIPAETPASAPSGGAAIPAVAGRTYSLAVVGDDKKFRLVIDQPFGGGRINDDLAGASGVGATVENASSSGAAQPIVIDSLARTGSEPDEPAVDGEPVQHSLWFTWTATDSGTVAFGAVPVYGSVGPFTATVYRYAETDGKPAPSFADLTAVGTAGRFTAVKGDVYYVSVAGPEEFFKLSVTASGVASSLDTTPPTVSCDPASARWTDAEFATVSCTASDSGSGLAQRSDATFTLQAPTTDGVEDAALTSNSRPVCDRAGNCTTAGPVTGLRGDRKPPVVVCEPPPVTWQSTAPAIACTARDAGSGLAAASDARRTFTASAPSGTEGRVTVPGGRICDVAGNCTQVAPVERVLVDRRAPKVTCDRPPTGPQTEDVTVACRARDDGSGLVIAGDADFTLTTSVGPGRSADGARTGTKNVCDLAGNCATAGPFGPFRIDTSPPSVTCTSADGASIDDWRAGPLTVVCSIADDGLGLAVGTPTRVTLTATVPVGRESDAVDATGSRVAKVCDRAGACTPVGPLNGLKIDRKPPAIACPDGSAQWLTGTSATVSCSVTDGGSGLVGAGTVTLRASQAAGRAGLVSTGTARVCDRVGNCALAGPLRLLVDRAPPVVRCAEPAARYEVEARISCTVTDAGSGVIEPDAAFTLVTGVGDGNADPKARTDSRKVCDRAGLCVTAGPFTVDVDLTSPPGKGPTMTVPDRVTVVAADKVSATQVVTYELPKAPGAVSVECRAPSGSAFGYGWTTVVCEAVSATGVSYASFPVVVKSLPGLAPTGGAVPGGAWRAVGVGFAPDAAVSVSIDGVAVTSARADGDGRVSRQFRIPTDLPTGEHRLGLAGVDADGNPLLATSPLSAVAASPGKVPPTAVPATAATLPTTGPELPPDPGPPPAAPAVGKGDFDLSARGATSSDGGVPILAVALGVGVVVLLGAGRLVLNARRRRRGVVSD